MSKQSDLQAQYRRLVKSIMRQARAAEKRGFTFDFKNKLSEPQRFTDKSIRKLERIKYDDTIYKYGEYKGMSGLEGRKVERHQAAVKGAETRAIIKQFENTFHMDWDELGANEKNIYREEGEDALRDYWHNVSPFPELIPEPEPEDIPKPSQMPNDKGEWDWTDQEPVQYNDAVLANIEFQIETYEPTPWYHDETKQEFRERVNILKRALNDAINTHGREAVAQYCQDNADKLADAIMNVMYGSDDDTVQADLQLCISIFNGGMQTVESAKKISELLEESNLDWTNGE